MLLKRVSFNFELVSLATLYGRNLPNKTGCGGNRSWVLGAVFTKESS